MPAFDPKRYHRIAVEEAFMIPEIAALDSARVPGRSESSKLRAYIMKSLLRDGRRADQSDGRGRHRDAGLPRRRQLACRISTRSKATSWPRLPTTASPRWRANIPAASPGSPASRRAIRRGAAQELERAVKKLGLKGGIVNSHSLGEYLDDKKFWPIFEALQAMDVPLYIHPRDPSPQMIKPFDVFGFKVGWSWAAKSARISSA